MNNNTGISAIFHDETVLFEAYWIICLLLRGYTRLVIIVEDYQAFFTGYKIDIGIFQICLRMKYNNMQINKTVFIIFSIYYKFKI